MFTGIVVGLGKVEKIASKKDVTAFTIALPISVAKGDSVCINGVCLTATGSGKRVVFEAVPETMKRTTLGRLKVGDRVNVEPSLRPSDRMGGHFVMGHVDGVGILESREPLGDSAFVRIRVPAEIARFLAPKGSVAVDGVSLTVVDVKPEAFSVALVPFTLRATTFGFRSEGDAVNVEIDILARYVHRLAAKKRSTGVVTKDFLKQAGFVE